VVAVAGFVVLVLVLIQLLGFTGLLIGLALGLLMVAVLAMTE
jgi:hypothetical protein